MSGVFGVVERDYVHAVSSHQLTEDALKGMLTRLDPHSDYMNEQEYREEQADLSGKFGGLGMQISDQGGIPKVVAPIDDTPAARAGIQPGDQIVSINGKSTYGADLMEIVRTLRGTPGTQVTITIARGSQTPFSVSLTRSMIKVATVKSKLQPNGIGYVRISEFGSDTQNELKQALAGLKQQAGAPLKGLVLDLRNDPGGLLAAAVAVAGDFLDGGTVVTVRGRRLADTQAINAPGNGTILPQTTPMVVLINGASASASEIVAGALQDRHRATLMGTQSFGKGSVQTIMPIKGHGALRLTTALYYTPSGRSIQGKGIAPDVVVDVPKDQQVAGEVIPRESTLRGALRNPGSLSTRRAPDAAAVPPEKVTITPPIKTQIVGTAEDAQLAAAITYLERRHSANQNTTNGTAVAPPRPGPTSR
jgi:carboxyl-terminal processing protease